MGKTDSLLFDFLPGFLWEKWVFGQIFLGSEENEIVEKWAWSKKVGFCPVLKRDLTTLKPHEYWVCGFSAHFPTFISLLIKKIKILYIYNKIKKYINMADKSGFLTKLIFQQERS